MKLALLAVVAMIACAACGACGKRPGGEPTVTPGASSVVVNRTSAPPDASVGVVRDVAMWASAREGSVEDLATLATHEGASGLVEAAAQPELRGTALRAMGYARGWGHLPYLVKVAGADSDDEARLALDALVELAARPRRSEDLEEEAELGAGCEALGTLAREAQRPRERRVVALRALRMMPCKKQELPTDLDAR